MKSLWFALPLVVLGLVLLGAACTVSTSPGGGFVEVVCAGDGSGCGSDIDCCSYLCNGGVCDPPADACTLDNDPCGIDADCCSDLCASDGYCGLDEAPAIDALRHDELDAPLPEARPALLERSRGR